MPDGWQCDTCDVFYPEGKDVATIYARGYPPRKDLTVERVSAISGTTRRRFCSFTCLETWAHQQAGPEREELARAPHA